MKNKGEGGGEVHDHRLPRSIRVDIFVRLSMSRGRWRPLTDRIAGGNDFCAWHPVTRRRIRISSGLNPGSAGPRCGRSKWNSTGRSAPLPFVPFPPSTPRLSPFNHLPIRRTAAAAIKRQRQVPEWRSAADAQCAPLLSSPRVQSKRAHPEPLTKRVLPRFIYLPFESSRFFSSTMYPTTMCPRWNFFVVGSSLGWREGCNWRSLFVSYSRKDKTSKNISASVSLNEKGAIIPRISLQANLFPLDFAYTRHSCVVTPFSSSTIKNFEFFSRLKRTFSLSQNNDIWLDVATFLASLTTRRNPMKFLSIQS